jgi:hypothetical protein
LEGKHDWPSSETFQPVIHIFAMHLDLLQDGAMDIGDPDREEDVKKLLLFAAGGGSVVVVIVVIRRRDAQSR